MQTALIESIIASTSLQLEVGGGIRQTDDIRRLLAAGARRVVVGTRAMEDWNWFKALVHQPEFSGQLVLAVDAKEGIIATRGWTASSAGARPMSAAKSATGRWRRCSTRMSARTG